MNRLKKYLALLIKISYGLLFLLWGLSTFREITLQTSHANLYAYAGALGLGFVTTGEPHEWTGLEWHPIQDMKALERLGMRLPYTWTADTPTNKVSFIAIPFWCLAIVPLTSLFITRWKLATLKSPHTKRLRVSCLKAFLWGVACEIALQSGTTIRERWLGIFLLLSWFTFFYGGHYLILRQYSRKPGKTLRVGLAGGLGTAIPPIIVMSWQYPTASIVAWLIGPTTAIVLGIAMVCLPFGIRSLILSRRKRRRIEVACRHCGYSLRGNESGNCPECGRPSEVPKEMPRPSNP